MNDTSAGWSPGSDDEDDDEGARRLRSTVERTLMDRARTAAERDRQKAPRRYGQHALAMSAALVLVLVIALGFDAFLTSVQRVLRMVGEEERRQEQEQAEPARDPADPMPAYAVPEDEPPPP